LPIFDLVLAIPISLIGGIVNVVSAINGLEHKQFKYVNYITKQKEALSSRVCIWLFLNFIYSLQYYVLNWFHWTQST